MIMMLARMYGVFCDVVLRFHLPGKHALAWKVGGSSLYKPTLLN